jgi:hypothetical protein
MTVVTEYVAVAILVPSLCIIIGCYCFELSRWKQGKLVPSWIIWLTIILHWACRIPELVLAIEHWRKHSSPLTQNACSVEVHVDADIGGIGVRLGFYILTGLTHVSLLLGIFCGEEIGTKELGIAQLVSKCKPSFRSIQS